MSSGLKKLSFQIDGKMVEGVAVSAGGVLWAHVNGQTFTVESEKKGRRGKGAAVAVNPGEILAPMPGKIIKVFVKLGDSVQHQQVLLVMEAMKMEYTLKAQAAGVVKSIACEAGEQVALGQTVVQLDVVK